MVKAKYPRSIGRKQVDWSMFQWGTTIPIEYHESFKNLGEQAPSNLLSRNTIVLLHQGIRYRAHIQKSSIKSRSNETYQIRYDSNKALIEKIRNVFRTSLNYIIAERERQKVLGKKKPYAVVPDDRAEYIDFLTTGASLELEMIFRPFSDIEEDDITYQNEVLSAPVHEHFQVIDAPKAKPKRVATRQNATFKRDIQTAKNAVVLSRYTCEFNPDHRDFTSDRTGENYVEAHHLIPMGFQELFPVSIDVEANIVSLCCSCHKRIHHAVFIEKKPLLDLLFEKRVDRLQSCGISVTIENFYTFYSN
ncbi:hypothetical protein EEL31_09860 [Brevibacillus laterosporus]|nr:hypothetical protein [Brevibacillus laterosporus]TPG68799.1 hypothetical protein EEL31_09860 [Brevibacillus laterosporus]